HISYSIRKACEDLHIGNATAHRAFRQLQGRGFIVCTKKGAFSWKIVNEVSEWRLTEHDNDFPAQHASKEFMRWQPSEPESNEPPKSRTRVLRRNDTGSVAERHGFCSGTTNVEKDPHGFCSGTTNVEKDPFIDAVVEHIHLPGMGPEGGERSAPVGSAVASEPPDWKTLGYPPDGPSREEHLAALERAALERGRSLKRRREGAA